MKKNNLQIKDKGLKKLLELKKEMIHFHKTRIPRCHKCKKNWVHDIDSITKKKSKYTWKANCKCLKKKLRLSIG